MLEIRYTKPDAAPWIDMLFAPVFALIGFSFLSKSDFAISLADQSRGFWAFALLMLYAVLAFIHGLILWRSSRVGRLYCRIDADGLQFFGRVWYRAWRWRMIDHIPWRDIESIDREPWTIQFTPRSWLKRFARHFILRANLMPAIIYRFSDKNSDEISAAVRDAAPDIKITIGKAGQRRRPLKLRT